MGNIATITDPLGRVQSFDYDDTGKVTKRTFADGSFVEYDYDDFGNLIAQVNELGHFWATTYDEFRNPLTKTDPLNRVTTYSYGENSPSACGACRASGKPTAITSPGGRVVRYVYDLEWRLVSETDAFGTPAAATTTYAYDAVGNLVQVTDPGGSITTRAYNNMDRVISITDALNRASLMAYDRAGNVISETRPDNGVTLHTYDKMDRRLTTRDPKNQTTTFTYDAEGNLASLTDARGKTYSWLYNALSQPTRKNYPDSSVTTLFLWDGWDLIKERDMSGAQIRRYVHGAAVDEILLMVDATGAKYHLHDALGSVSALTDSTGAILESYQYDVFGKVTVTDSSLIAHPSSPLGNRFLYTGREWIAEAQLYDYRNRVYSPVIGRFMQIDPIRFSAGDVNMYRYVGNGVVMWIDPLGLDLSLAGGGPQPDGNGNLFIGVIGTNGDIPAGIYPKPNPGGNPFDSQKTNDSGYRDKPGGGRERDPDSTEGNQASVPIPPDGKPFDIEIPYTDENGDNKSATITIDPTNKTWSSKCPDVNGDRDKHTSPDADPRASPGWPKV